MKKFIVCLICLLTIVKTRPEKHDKIKAKCTHFIDVTRNGDKDSIKLLLEKGDDMNQATKDGSNVKDVASFSEKGIYIKRK